jgi:hypothetical protein
MSQSLNRIRSLISDIDQIQKQGQRSTRSSGGMEALVFAEQRSLAAVAPPVVAPPVVAPPVQVAAPEPAPQAPEPVSSPGPSPSPAPSPAPAPESRVKVEWSGAVILELQLSEADEKVELRQRNGQIEISFSDGKAFHIPFKAVA